MITTLVLAAATVSGFATPSPSDLRNIALSQRIAAKVGDDIWPGWSRTPWAIDLLTGHGSALIGFHMPNPPAFPTNLEAEFPLYDGINTIVIGEPKYTQSTDPVRWSVTLLHEHFHEWQYDHPQFQQAIVALDLAPKNSRDGMWMLNYPFPYSDTRIAALYATMAQRLANAVAARSTPAFSAQFQRYRIARRAFRSALKPADYRYFTFQCWQEGVARYTEYAAASAAAREHRADSRFLTAAEATRLSNDAAWTYHRIISQLTSAALPRDRRVAFYALGAGEALVLDRAHPAWKQHYFTTGADLSNQF